ncbi:MAG TPA: glycosyl hydrolase 115 family protein [Acidobacteriaceae bacterium]|nr:glycosyl hydrolase 115 family protein [Acidobacteriaceae bacterium]
MSSQRHAWLISAMIIAASVVPARGKKLAATDVRIDGSITIVEGTDVTGPVRLATNDLRSDFNKVFGVTPRLVNSLSEAGPVSILIAQGPALPFGVKCTMAHDLEAFAFSVAAVPGKDKAKRAVCLTGADMRGTIFAIFQFSQSYLGVDPMYLWTDKQPEKRSSLTLPADFPRVYPTPVFKYRGFFPNDEDLLTGWIPAEKGQQTGISLKTWDNIYETILRLKGNMVVPGTWIFPDDAQVHLATERGLIINQHHAIPLGVNVARWPKDVPYNFSAHPEILERAWTNAVATYKPDEEILWSVGLRGLSDQSYARLDPSVRDNDPLLGQRISEAIDAQMRIVRARYPKAQFVTDLWQEGARLMQKGYLKIPPEVTLVWADTGYGDMQDGGQVAAGQGAYFHVAMMNGEANQLSEMVPVARIQSELGRYIRAGATTYLLVNTSDIRPVAMTTRALMEVAWGGLANGNEDDTAYYKQWATEEFGAKSADALTEVYKEYFAAPALRPNGPPGLNSGPQNTAKREYGDQHYHTEIRRILLDTLSEHQVAAMPSQSPKWTPPRLAPSADAQTRHALLEQDIQECEAAQPRWDAVWEHAVAAESLVDPDRRDYYQAEMLTMITINRESNRSLLLVARALEHAEAGQTDQARSEIAEAIHALDTIEDSMTKGEYGKWIHWYRGDWLTGVYRTRVLVQSYADHLQDPLAKLPAPLTWSGWEAYFHIMEYEGDRVVDVH